MQINFFPKPSGKLKQNHCFGAPLLPLCNYFNKFKLDSNITSKVIFILQYLGDMEECSGVAYQDQDTYITLSILNIQDFVLIPGQTLPLQITRLNDVAMIREVIKQPDKTFGVLTTK